MKISKQLGLIEILSTGEVRFQPEIKNPPVVETREITPPDASVNPKSLNSTPRFTPAGSVYVIPVFSYAQILGRDESTGTNAKIISSLSPGVTLGWAKLLTETQSFHLQGTMQEFSFYQDDVYNISNSNLKVFGFEAGYSYNFKGSIFGLNLKCQDQILYRATSQTSLNLETVPTNQIEVSTERTLFKIGGYLYPITLVKRDPQRISLKSESRLFLACQTRCLA